ncbi:MAG: DUF2190 family protein [Myxococcota bacterium]|nr:DUF2190 family protein [Myxococcota bacterium]
MGLATGDANVVAKRLVKWHTDQKTVVLAGAGDPVIGVVIGNKGQTFALGEEVSVCIAGITEVEAGGTVAQDALVGAGTSGKAAAIAIGVATADNDLAGKAWSAATNDGDLMKIFVNVNPFVGNA